MNSKRIGLLILAQVLVATTLNTKTSTATAAAASSSMDFDEPRRSPRASQPAVIHNVGLLPKGELSAGKCDPLGKGHKSNSATYRHYLYGWKGDALIAGEQLQPEITLESPFIKIGKTDKQRLLLRYRADLIQAFAAKGKVSPTALQFVFGFNCLSGCEDGEHMEKCATAGFRNIEVTSTETQQRANRQEINERSLWLRSGWTEWYEVPDFEHNRDRVTAQIAANLRTCGFLCEQCTLQDDEVVLNAQDPRQDERQVYESESLCKTDIMDKQIYKTQTIAKFMEISKELDSESRSSSSDDRKSRTLPASRSSPYHRRLLVQGRRRRSRTPVHSPRAPSQRSRTPVRSPRR